MLPAKSFAVGRYWHWKRQPRLALPGTQGRSTVSVFFPIKKKGAPAAAWGSCLVCAVSLPWPLPNGRPLCQLPSKMGGWWVWGYLRHIVQLTGQVRENLLTSRLLYIRAFFCPKGKCMLNGSTTGHVRAIYCLRKAPSSILMRKGSRYSCVPPPPS